MQKVHVESKIDAMKFLDCEILSGPINLKFVCVELILCRQNLLNSQIRQTIIVFQISKEIDTF